MVRDVTDICERVKALPLTEKDLKRAKKLFAELEAKRIERMNSPVEE